MRRPATLRHPREQQPGDDERGQRIGPPPAKCRAEHQAHQWVLWPAPDQQEVALVLWRRSRLDGIDCIVSVQMGGQAAPFPRGAACSLNRPPALRRVRAPDTCGHRRRYEDLRATACHLWNEWRERLCGASIRAGVRRRGRTSRSRQGFAGWRRPRRPAAVSGAGMTRPVARGVPTA